LISSPDSSPPGTRKRKGSDDDVVVHGTRNGNVASATVTMDDPEVRVVVEALGGLKGGGFYHSCS
jgi:hypothetical protein